VVVADDSRFGEEQGDGGELIDVEVGPDGGWKRWRVTSAPELFGDCSYGIPVKNLQHEWLHLSLSTKWTSNNSKIGIHLQMLHDPHLAY
jgi:hypothetical protein